MTLRRPLRALLALLVSGVLVGCGSTPSSEGGFVNGDGSLTMIAPDRRAAAPTIRGETLEGTPWSSESAQGKVLVYNVWGSWCAPCRKEAPALVAAAKRTADIAVFIGLNTRDLDRAQAQAFVRAFEVDYPNLYDPNARLLLEFGTQLPPSAIPTTLVVDRQGRVAARIIGEVTTPLLAGLVEDVAKGG
ncbi:MAG: TlpA disulfide reductase family protein [Micropruina sp.]